MTPYASFGFFTYLLALLLPAVVLGLFGKSQRSYYWIVCLVGILVVYSDFLKGYHTYWFVVLFLAGEWFVTHTYLTLVDYLRRYSEATAAPGEQVAAAGLPTPEYLAGAYAIPLETAYRLHTLARRSAAFARHLERFGRSYATWAYRMVLLAALLPLILVKLYPVVRHSVIGFLGVSYLTFRCVQVIIEVHSGLIRELRFTDYFAFILSFPSLSAGPIDRYRRFLAEWSRTKGRQEYLEYLYQGIDRMFRGFLYKFVLAAVVNQYWLAPVSSAPKNLWSTVSYMYAYSLYLFFDFAGYSAFAIGVSYVLGVKLQENFHRPFLSTSIKDFWNRWHISLSSWLRDYVYLPFLYTNLKKHQALNKQFVSALGYVLTMGLMGLWHGFELHFILYGLYHAFLMAGYELFERWNQRRQFWGTGSAWKVASAVITLQFVCFGFLLFSGRLIS